MKRSCKNCGEHIPYWITLDGKKRNLKSRVFCLKCSPFGQHNTRNLSKSFVVINGKEQPKSSVERSKSRRRNKQRAVEYMGGKCCICGYNKCFAALEFHHSDPSGKNNDPGKMIHQWRWDRIVEEIDKCILVCSNCHREIHYGLYKKEDFKRLIKPILTLRCVLCDKKYNTRNESQIYCSPLCSQMGGRKVERPNKEDLLKLVWSMPTTKIAKKFNVSGKAVEKWCRGYKIEKPPRGYWQKLNANPAK